LKAGATLGPTSQSVRAPSLVDGAIAGEVLGTGDYCRTAAGVAPQASTRSGCTLLVISAGREGLA